MGKFCFAWLGWIEQVLEQTVQLAGTSLATRRGTEHLHLLHGIDTMLRQILPHQVANTFCSQPRL